MIPGQTSVQVVENKSKGGEKPWADVFVVRCTNCRAVRRFPAVLTKRPQRQAGDVGDVVDN